MRDIDRTNKFKKDYKRCMKRGHDPAKLQAVILLLATDEPLPEACRPHKLVGNYDGYWECHIAPDWLLIYDFPDEDTLKLSRMGSHADLF